MIGLFIGKEDKRQGITRNPEINVMQRIGRASWYSGSRPYGLTETENTLIEHAREQLNNTFIVYNDFFNIEWSVYRVEMEKLELSPFKKVELIEIKN